jgi:signal peptide peptidase SppA
MFDLAGSALHLAFLDRDHANIVSALRNLATADDEKVRASFVVRKLDLLSAYGLAPVAQTMQKPFAYAAGTAIIPIHGMLVNRLNWSDGVATGYDFIRSQYRAALSDPDVKQIVFDVNSNGGLVSGCSELAQELYDLRGAKPSLAVVDARAYSAAYYVASAADRVVCTPSGGVGSIGVLAMHVDYSNALDHAGIKVTLLHKGEEKVDGNSLEPLSDRAKDSIERDIGYHYDQFIGAVSRNRGVATDDVRATEARCFLPGAARDIGLIDDIKTPMEAVAEFGSQEDVVMELSEEQVRTIAREAVEADRARVAGIRNHAEAKGREGLADHLAFNTGMSVADALTILTAAPKQAAEPPTHFPPPTGFASVMDGDKHPRVGPDVSESGQEISVADRILANYTSVTGAKVLPLRRVGE